MIVGEWGEGRQCVIVGELLVEIVDGMCKARDDAQRIHMDAPMYEEQRPQPHHQL